MADETVVNVMKILSAIDLPLSTAQQIEEWGNEAVTVVCEVALGSYPGLRPKVRTNAVALLGEMTHPQAIETTALLINDANSDVAIRALRAAGQQKNDQVVGKIEQLLKKADSSPIVAAEAVKSLLAIDSAKSRAAVETYEQSAMPHRDSRVVADILRTRRTV